jgi:hypothetical protein
VLLAPRAIRQLRHVTGEWDSVTAIVVDQVLPLDSLVFHAGSEPFGGKNSACYDDLYVRLYAARGATPAFLAAVRRLTRLDGRLGWVCYRQGYSAWYGDYGGAYQIDYFVREEGPRTLVLVFMYGSSLRMPDHEPEIEAILESIRSYHSP